MSSEVIPILSISYLFLKCFFWVEELQSICVTKWLTRELYIEMGENAVVFVFMLQIQGWQWTSRGRGLLDPSKV